MDEGVKKDLPEIYHKAQKVQQVNVQSDAQNETTHSLKENVDFSKPEEAKKYFNNFYKNFANCKTREEKLKHIESLGISLGNEQQQDEIISKFEARRKIRDIKENIRTKFKEANPDLQDEELEQALENAAVEQYSIENNKDFKTEKNNNNMMIQLETYLLEIEKLKQDISNCHDENRKKGLEEKLSKLEEKKICLLTPYH